jgi:hypothetical protein
MSALLFTSFSPVLRMRRSHRTAVLLAQFLLASLLGLVALGELAYADDPDPPTRVARLSFITGDVYVQPAEANDWIQARINRPLTNNDQLWTDNGARAELQAGNSAVQIDENTQLSVLELSDTVLQLQLTQGTVSLHVRGMDRDETIEIDSPNAATAIQEPGTYRIEVGNSGDLTVVQVRTGSAEVSGERQNFSLRENEQATLRGTTRLAAEFDELGRLDDFDRWAAARNSRANHVVAAQYVSSDVVGYEDLDDYGYWRNEPEYGQVWIPSRVVVGWSPYRYGHWDWITPWGWTWVDDAPWGFAPFHYGRWARVRDNWCWVPGPRTGRAVYAPALVAWVGTPGVSVAVNIGTRPVGWVPLAPREIYRPNYRGSPRYVERVNLSNSLLRSDEFERGYRRAPRDENFSNRAAATVVSADAMRSAQPVNRNLVRTDVRKLQPVDAAPNVRPDRAAIVGGGRVVATPPQVMTREVVARRAPMPIAQPTNSVVAPRGTVRVVEPNEPRRPFVNEQVGQRPGQSITPPMNQPQPATGQGPNRVARPDDNAQPNRRANEPFIPGNARPENNERAIQNNNEESRGVRRGFVTPRSEPPAAPSNTPAPAERRQALPQVENNADSMRPAMRERPAQEQRNRVIQQPRQEPPQQVQPRAVTPNLQRAEPAPQPQRAQPAPQAQPPQPAPQQQNKQNNDDDRRRKQHENDTR